MRPAEAFALGYFGGLWAIAYLTWMAIEWAIGELTALWELYGVYVLAAVLTLGTLIALRMIVGSYGIRSWRAYGAASETAEQPILQRQLGRIDAIAAVASLQTGRTSW